MKKFREKTMNYDYNKFLRYFPNKQLPAINVFKNEKKFQYTCNIFNTCIKSSFVFDTEGQAYEEGCRTIDNIISVLIMKIKNENLIYKPQKEKCNNSNDITKKSKTSSNNAEIKVFNAEINGISTKTFIKQNNRSSNVGLNSSENKNYISDEQNKAFNMDLNTDSNKSFDYNKQNNKAFNIKSNGNESKNVVKNKQNDRAFNAELNKNVINNKQNNKVANMELKQSFHDPNLNSKLVYEYCVKNKLVFPEYTFEKQNGVFICSAFFQNKTFQSKYTFTKQEAKEDVCTLISNSFKIEAFTKQEVKEDAGTNISNSFKMKTKKKYDKSFEKSDTNDVSIANYNDNMLNNSNLSEKWSDFGF